MPELPEVETVRTALENAAKGQVIKGVETSGKKMRWPIPADISEQITDGFISGLRRRGKYILMDIKPKDTKSQRTEKTMLIHLGMSGSVRIYEKDSKSYQAEKHDHMVMSLSDQKIIVLNDPRRFGGVDLMKPVEEVSHPLLKHMGIEPLANSLDGDFLRNAFKGKAVSIKSALLDQRIIAGIGNIYASEACFRAGIHPARKAGKIGHEKCVLLAGAIRNVLQEAIKAGGTSLRDHVQPGGEIGYFIQQLNVYGKEQETCTKCEAKIKMIRQTGRATYYCPQCQR